MTDQYSPNNLLATNNFKFEIPNMTNFNAHVLACPIPAFGVNELGNSDGVATPFSGLKLAGDHMSFADLPVRVKIDETMMVFQEIGTWLFATGFPDSFQQFTTLDTNLSSYPNPYLDATLTILDSRESPVMLFTFKNLYPISVGQIEFDSTKEDVQYAETTMTFRYQSFSFSTVVNGAVTQNLTSAS